MPAIPSGAPGDRPAEASQRGRAMTASEAGAAIAREPMPGEGGPPPASADSVLAALVPRRLTAKDHGRAACPRPADRLRVDAKPGFRTHRAEPRTPASRAAARPSERTAGVVQADPRLAVRRRSLHAHHPLLHDAHRLRAAPRRPTPPHRRALPSADKAFIRRLPGARARLPPCQAAPVPAPCRAHEGRGTEPRGLHGIRLWGGSAGIQAARLPDHGSPRVRVATGGTHSCRGIRRA